jgi:hypothetical protein
VTILMAAMGDQVGKMPWHWWLALFAAAAVSWLLVRRCLGVRTSNQADLPKRELPPGR